MVVRGLNNKALRRLRLGPDSPEDTLLSTHVQGRPPRTKYALTGWEKLTCPLGTTGPRGQAGAVQLQGECWLSCVDSRDTSWRLSLVSARREVYGRGSSSRRRRRRRDGGLATRAQGSGHHELMLALPLLLGKPWATTCHKRARVSAPRPHASGLRAVARMGTGRVDRRAVGGERTSCSSRGNLGRRDGRAPMTIDFLMCRTPRPRGAPARILPSRKTRSDARQHRTMAEERCLGDASDRVGVQPLQIAGGAASQHRCLPVSAVARLAALW
ncbi:hypothetical protein JHW43_009358 [Diplocarpon mali]|nr:hypothetical protein JHW43_009358 [Diplocarpon mali]